MTRIKRIYADRFNWLLVTGCWLLLFGLVACNSETLVEPTATFVPTVEPIPTKAAESATAEPTSEPDPTATPLPEPTNTPLADAVYLDATQPIEARVDDLLGRMTLAEKIGQMTLIQNHSIKPDAVTDFKLGAVLSGGGGGPQGIDDNSAEAWHTMVTSYQQAALETRLRIPLLYGVDAVHGHSNVTGATLFPHNIGLGATRNPDLLFEIGRVTALETLATSIHWDYAPVLAVARDMRWGRAYEAYSEDTQLVTDLGKAYMLGLQSVDGVSDLSDSRTLLATAKHWVGDGGTAWGSSTTADYSIDQGDTQIDEATLREVHIAPYIPAIEAGAMSVMVSYSSWNGEKLHGQKYLITDVLKDELGFNGFVVSDWQAIDQIDSSYDQAVIRAINAGIDMSMEPFDARKFIRVLTKAVNDGDVSEARIDDAVRRILRAKFALGLFEQPMMDESLLATVGSRDHREIARQAVRESLVLLKNANSTLPLSNEAATVFIAGQHADDIGLQSGGWSIEWQGASGDITDGTTILEAVTDVLGSSADIHFDRFGKFEQVEGSAEIGIVVQGERPYAEGRGDRDVLAINPTIVTRMRERADVVILVLITGRPLDIQEALEVADAVVVAWLPGTEGTGITDILFGDNDFTGKLPVTWQRTTTQLPFNFANIPTEGCDAPLFPFGYGLTFADDGAVEQLSCP